MNIEWFFEAPGILVTVGIILVIITFILLVVCKKNTSVTIVKNNNPEELKKFMETHNFPEEMIKNMSENGTVATNITTTKTIKTVKYVNGQKISEETHNENNHITPLTNCPNCGAMIEQGNTGVCRYCNTSFKTYQINQ